MVDSSERSHSGTRPIPSLLSAMLRASDGILELLPIATFICDAEGTILQYNRHAVAVWVERQVPDRRTKIQGERPLLRSGWNAS